MSSGSLPIFILLFLLILTLIGFVFFEHIKKKILLKRSLEKMFLLVKIPRTDSQQDKDKDRATGDDFKQKIARMEQFLMAMHSTHEHSLHARLFGQDTFSLEIASSYVDEKEGIQISFYVICSYKIVSMVERQITAYYPDAHIEKVKDYNIFSKQSSVISTRFSMLKKHYYPIRNYDQFESDPMNGIVNSMSALQFGEGVSIQLLLQPKGHHWSEHGKEKAHKMFQGKKKHGFFKGFFKFLFLGKEVHHEEQEKLTPAQEELVKKMEEKANKPIFDVSFRVIASAPSIHQAHNLLNNITSSFRQYNMYDLNGLIAEHRQKKTLVNEYISRSPDAGKFSLDLSTSEIAGIFHFPSSFYNPNPVINWLKFKVAPAPAVLATDGILLGYNNYRGSVREVRLSPKDRFRHLYIIGQTGMGKSVLQKSLIKQDLALGNGICVVDPHGDLIDECLEWVPKERAQDVILFDPNDSQRPLGLNLLEAKTPEEMDFIALDAMNMMISLFGNEIFGPRIQDYFRNGCLTLMADIEEGGAITDIVRLFTDDAFQKFKLTKVTNPVVRSFWEDQMAKTGEREKGEMIPYFAAKFGQFITNTTMRNIVGQTKSSFDFTDAMNSKKIIFVKLAKGLIGQINANLLGMIFVNKIQVAAMRRASQPGDDRVPFFLYVDEFQNFVTDAFESILSEARKYKLGLIIAHQYINQLMKEKGDEKVRHAVFGNVGSMLNFKIGATDAEAMSKEMAPTFSESDLIALESFQACIKVSVNGMSSVPFSLQTIKDFEPGNKKLAETIVQISRLKWGRDAEFVGKEILMRMGVSTI